MLTEKTHELSNMSDAELLEHYRSAKAESMRLLSELQQLEFEFVSIHTLDSASRIDPARAACRCIGNQVNRFHVEISRRLHAPLKSARLAKGLNQGEAAKRAGWTRALLADIEAGRYCVDFTRCIQMWKALNLKLPDGWESLAQS